MAHGIGDGPTVAREEIVGRTRAIAGKFAERAEAAEEARRLPRESAASIQP
jgi:hypothetical protein